jgi:hypothetical protein
LKPLSSHGDTNQKTKPRFIKLNLTKAMKAIDKERRGHSTTIRPAKLTDDGDEIDAVAKITTIDEDDEEIKERLIRSVQRHRKVQDHDSILKYGYQIVGDKFILLVEPAEGSLEEALRPTAPDAIIFSEKVFNNLSPKEIIRRFFRPLVYIHTID